MARKLRSWPPEKSPGLAKALSPPPLLPAAATVSSLMNCKNALHAKRKCPVKRAWMTRALRASWSLKCAVDRKAVLMLYLEM
jgi:hypothetical protein